MEKERGRRVAVRGMNSVIKSLLEIVQAEPLPASHTSSHWQHYGRETIVEYSGDELLVLRASGFSAQTRTSFLGGLLCGAERLSYARVTRRLKSYPFVWSEAKKLARDLHAGLTRHEWTSAVILAILTDHFNEYNISPKTFALIGDGDGFLGALIFRCLSGTNIEIYSIDLPKMLVFQAYTHETASCGAKMSVLSANQTGRQNITFVQPKDTELIPCQIDCAISYVSMQEMTAFSIASYFTFLRRRSGPHSRFYCVNRVRKELPGGEVASFFDYPWMENDEMFIDEPCPYIAYFFAKHRYPNGPRLFGARVPFINYPDGAGWHRLVRLAPLT